MFYAAVKHLHLTCVILSITGFCLRGVWRLKNSALMERRWVRLAPHINDTLLLAAAITLTLLTAQYPFAQAWLTAKIFGLIAYIILGSLALRPRSGKRLRLMAGIGAVVVFGWIVSVALTRQPGGFLAGIV
jgi:uncharacterized membrane protein SirB2